MVRKTHRGILGKEKITMNNRPYRGPGIGFKEEGVSTGPEIKKAARRRNWRPTEDI